LGKKEEEIYSGRGNCMHKDPISGGEVLFMRSYKANMARIQRIHFRMLGGRRVWEGDTSQMIFRS